MDIGGRQECSQQEAGQFESRCLLSSRTSENFRPGYTFLQKRYNDAVMLNPIGLMYQTMLAELGQRSLDAAWSAHFPPDGRFTPVTVKQRRY